MKVHHSAEMEWFHIHVKTVFFHLSVWLIGAVDLGSIPGNSQVRQKGVVGQKLQILQICGFFKT